MMWSEKYRPKKVEQMIGNEQARLDAVKWLASWVIGTKPLLLIGPPGTGKTTLARILANQFGYDLVEMNASDTRNKLSLKERIDPLFANTTNLMGKTLMLFLDEVDGISGREDTGGIDLVIEVMKEPMVPVIMAANEKSNKIRALAKACKTIEFKPIAPRLMSVYLDHVLKSENIEMGPGFKLSSATTARGDLRAMLNSAQSRAAGYATDSKEQEQIGIGDAVTGYFSADSLKSAQSFLANVDATYPDPRYQNLTPESRRKDIIGAIFSSVVSSKLDRESLASILEVVSRADIFVGRSGRLRDWKLLKYVTPILAKGIFSASRNKLIEYSQYSMPWQIMGPLLARGQTVRNLVTALVAASNTSRSVCGLIVLPYLLFALRQSEGIDLHEFCAASFGDESIAEPLSKLLGKN